MSDLSTSSKICSHCGQEKTFSEYHRDKSKKDGFRSKCKTCSHEYRLRYYQSNVDRAKQYSEGYYRHNHDSIKEYQASYRMANSGKVRERLAEWHLGNKGTWLHFFNRRWTKINNRTINGANPRWDWERVRRYLEKGVRLEMNREEFREWCESKASIIEQMYRDAEELKDDGLRPSLDRIDPDGHYSISNIQILSWSDNCRLSRRGN